MAFSGKLFRRNCAGPPLFDASCVVGVGHKPDAVAAVRGADGARWYAIPFRVIPERGQVPKNGSETA